MVRFTMLTRIILLSFVFLAGTIGGYGCQTTASVVNLQSSIAVFNQNLRWERFTGAAAFLPLKDRQNFIIKYNNLENDLFIQNLEVKNVQPVDQADNQRTRVLLIAEYYVLPSTVVQRQAVTQYWEFIDGSWQLTDPGFAPVRPEKIITN